MQTKLYHAPQIHCSSCAMLLEGLEDEIEGIEEVTVHVKRQQVRVMFDESVVSEEVIKDAARKEGYELELTKEQA